jgi:hypothetical protein
MDNKSCGIDKPANNSCDTQKNSCDIQKKSCSGTICKGALAGGIILFGYYALSWGVLPWNKGSGMTVFGEDHTQSLHFLLFCLFAAALLTKVLKKIGAACCPVMGSAVLGVLVGSFQHVTDAVWGKVTWGAALTGLLDVIIAFTLAGLVISKIALPASSGDCGDKKGSCH